MTVNQKKLEQLINLNTCVRSPLCIQGGTIGCCMYVQGGTIGCCMYVQQFFVCICECSLATENTEHMMQCTFLAKPCSLDDLNLSTI